MITSARFLQVVPLLIVILAAFAGWVPMSAHASSDGLLATLQLGGSPIGVAYSPANGEVYVSNEALSTVSVLNGMYHSVVTAVNVGSSPIGLAYNPLNMAMYVANAGSNTLSILNRDNTLSSTTVSVGAYPEGILYDPANGNIYVANRDSNTISVINGTDNTLLTTINDSGGLKGVAFDPVNDYLYFVGIGGVVSIVDGTTNTIVKTLTLSSYPYSSPFGIAYDPLNNDIYVADDSGKTISIINGRTNELQSTLSFYPGAIGLAYDPVTTDFFVTNVQGVVTVLDASTNTIHSQITVSTSDVWGVAMDQATGEVYTANTSAGTVSIIKIAQSTTSSTLNGGSASVDQTSTTGVSVSITGSTSPNGAAFSVTSIALGNAQPVGTGALSLAAMNYYDVSISGITDGTANVCITNQQVSSQTTMEYWTGSVWTNATSLSIMSNTVCGSVPVASLNGTPIAIGNPLHAKLVDETRAQFVHENLVTQPAQVLFAGVKNDGIGGSLAPSLTAYVTFTVTGSMGFNAVYYTQVVSILGGQILEGKSDPRLSISFQPPSTPDHYTVTARVYYSSTHSIVIGDHSFVSLRPDNTRNFQFTTY